MYTQLLYVVIQSSKSPIKFATDMWSYAAGSYTMCTRRLGYTHQFKKYTPFS